MGECEVCGRIVSEMKRAEIDGVVLEVCDKCAKLGKEVVEAKPVVIRRRPAETIEEERELVEDFAKRIRKARESRNLRQDEAAQKIGISSSLLRRIEGGFKPDETTVKRLQRFYGIKLYR